MLHSTRIRTVQQHATLAVDKKEKAQLLSLLITAKQTQGKRTFIPSSLGQQSTPNQNTKNLQRHCTVRTTLHSTCHILSTGSLLSQGSAEQPRALGSWTVQQETWSNQPLSRQTRLLCECGRESCQASSHYVQRYPLHHFLQKAPEESDVFVQAVSSRMVPECVLLDHAPDACLTFCSWSSGARLVFCACG